MGRRRQAKRQKQGDQQGEKKPQGEQHHGEGTPTPPAASLAVAGAHGLVAVAAGPEVRVFDARLGEVRTLRRRVEGAGPHQQFVRSLAFDPAGAYLAAACDDKSAGMLLWDTASWEQVRTLKVPKRLSAVALTHDGTHMLAADKFGDVQVAATQGAAAAAPELLLGHFCSILTSVSVSRCGRFVATTDRDGKARVSVLPPAPLAGAHDIQAFCLGHTGAVTCSAFVAKGGKELLVTGGTDGTVRLWDHLDGRLLATWDPQQALKEQEGEGAEAGGEQEEGAGEEQADGAAEAAGEAAAAGGEEEGEGASQEQVDGEGEGEGAEGQEEGCAAAGAANQGAPAVLSVAASPDGSWVAVAVEDRDEVALLRLDWGGAAPSLAEAGWRRLPGLHMLMQLAFGPGNRLWAVGGPPTEESAATFLACATVLPDGGLGEEGGPLPAEALAALQAHDGSEEATLAAADEAARARRAARLAQLRRSMYDTEERQRRKRQRRDVRAKAEQAAATGAAQQEQQQQQRQE